MTVMFSLMLVGMQLESIVVMHCYNFQVDLCMLREVRTCLAYKQVFCCKIINLFLWLNLETINPLPLQRIIISQKKGWYLKMVRGNYRILLIPYAMTLQSRKIIL